jgi:hypothetical protein
MGNDEKNSNFEPELLDLIAYMLTSARGLVDEPAMYGPFRLLEGVSRFSGILLKEDHADKNFLIGLKEKIDERKYSLMTDQEQFIHLMDETVLDITRYLMSKNKE